MHTGNLSTQKVETGGSRSSSAVESLRTAVSRERKKRRKKGGEGRGRERAGGGKGMKKKRKCVLPQGSADPEP